MARLLLREADMKTPARNLGVAAGGMIRDEMYHFRRRGQAPIQRFTEDFYLSPWTNCIESSRRTANGNWRITAPL
jgi:hypothetical protein